ncbi:hypothetical protein Ndes2526B_g05351 [Nannochloris sp. 'desiccata']|nr:putative CSC1-like protein [Chlorella desiccata (nom. nud.)]
MATSGKGFAISLGIYAFAFTAILLLFSFLRRWRVTRKFYAPREFLSKHETTSSAAAHGLRSDSLHQGLLPSPPPLGASFLGWIPSILRARESQLLLYAGVDATLYLKILRLGIEIFTLVSLVVLIAILPINLTSGYLSTLMPSDSPESISTSGYTPSDVSQYTFWVPPIPTDSETENNSDTNGPETIEPPPIYNDSIPDPPPGIIWWQYLPDVPLLPDITTALGPGYERYGWRYDDDYVIQKYYFTDLDKTTMANVPPKSSRLYAHSVLTWVVTAIALWRIWSMCRTALRLRQYHLLTVLPGAETHSVLVTDIPGVPYGTIIDRLAGSFLMKLIPQKVKSQAAAKVAALKRSPTQIMRRRLPGRGIGPSGGGVIKPGKTVTGGTTNVGREIDVEVYGTAAAAAGRSSDNETLPPISAVSSTYPQQQESSALFSHQQHQQHQFQQQEQAFRFAAIDRWDEAVQYLNAGFTVPELVEDKFKEIYDTDVAAVQVVQDTSSLDTLVASYDKLKNEAASAVDTAVAQYSAGKKVKIARKVVVGATLGEWGREKYGVKPVKTDAFEFYRERLVQLRESIATSQDAAADLAFPSGFVTFKKRKAQVVAAGAMMSEDLSAWKTQAAPRPDEVLWKNLGLRQWERSSRHAAMWVAFFVLIAFFMIPVTAVQALLSTNSLVGFIQDIPILNSLVTAVLPGLALVIFLALLPPILRFMRTLAGSISISQIDHGVVTWFFIFQVITVFFGSFIAGTFANQFEVLIKNPGDIVNLLGTAAPQTAIFFMTFISAQAFISTPLSLLRTVGLVLFLIKSRFAAATPRAKLKLQESSVVKQTYGTQIPADTIAALLGLTFCIICPIIAPLALLYFGVNYLVNKYHLMAVAKESYQSGGLVWLHVFNQLITGLIIFQITMIALLGIKKAPTPSLILLPLPFITLIFAYIAHSTFWRPMRTLSLLTAARRDSVEAGVEGAVEEREEGGGGATTSMVVAEEAQETYLSPSFKIDDEEHQELVEQCEILRRAQADGDYSRLKQLANGSVPSEMNSSSHVSFQSAGSDVVREV